MSNRAALAGGIPGAAREAPRKEFVTCGIYRVEIARGHRAVHLPYGQGRHIIHARCVVEALRRIASPAPLYRRKSGCGAHYGRREALETAVQADPGLPGRKVRVGGGLPATMSGVVVGFAMPGTRIVWGSGRRATLSHGRTYSNASSREESVAKSGESPCLPTHPGARSL